MKFPSAIENIVLSDLRTDIPLIYVFIDWSNGITPLRSVLIIPNIKFVPSSDVLVLVKTVYSLVGGNNGNCISLPDVLLINSHWKKPSNPVFMLGLRVL